VGRSASTDDGSPPGFKPNQKRNFGGARYGWKMMGGKLVDLLARM